MTSGDDGGPSGPTPPVEDEGGASSDATVGGSAAEASADGGLNDAEEGGGVTGLGNTCIAQLFGTYVLRTDGVLIAEGSSGSPETIIDDSTGFPLEGIVNVQVGGSHGCAALMDGSVKCWQVTSSGNTSGQLGNGTTSATSALFRATPVLTAASTPLSGVAAVAAGDSSSNASCAVRTDGKLYCWGDLTWIAHNGSSLLTGYAQAITTDGSTPLAGVKQAAVGASQACVLATGDAGATNSVWCWGYNSAGELGVGDANNRPYPTQVTGLTNPTKLVIDAAGGNYQFITVCALDGANVRCWGSNWSGAAGTNTTTSSILNPTAVVTMSGALLDNVSDIESGVSAFGVLRGDGTLWTWGAGYAGYAANYGLTNIVALGWAGQSNGPRFITSDAVYHNAMTNFPVDCNAM
jgi:alpha-tubulin suppressor-like RCC1 family protein